MWHCYRKLACQRESLRDKIKEANMNEELARKVYCRDLSTLKYQQVATDLEDSGPSVIRTV